MTKPASRRIRKAAIPPNDLLDIGKAENLARADSLGGGVFKVRAKRNEARLIFLRLDRHNVILLIYCYDKKRCQ